MVLADTVNIPWEAIIAFSIFIGGGLLTWFAYVMKQLVEHAKWMAAANEKFDRALDLSEAVSVDLKQVLAEQERVRLELARVVPHFNR